MDSGQYEKFVLPDNFPPCDITLQMIISWGHSINAFEVLVPEKKRFPHAKNILNPPPPYACFSTSEEDKKVGVSMSKMYAKWGYKSQLIF